MLNFNKTLLPFLLLVSCCNCNPSNNSDPKQPEMVSTTIETSTNAVPTPVVSANSSTSALEPVPEPPTEEVLITDGWEKMSGLGWSALAPVSLDSNQLNASEYMAVISVPGGSMVFAADVNKNVHISLDELHSDFRKNLLTSHNVNITGTVPLNINGNNCIKLITSSKESTLEVNIYLFYVNNTSYVFSCGNKSFDDNAKQVCSDIVNTVKFY